MIFEDLKLAEFNDFYKVILGNFPSKEIKEYDYMKETFINGDFKVLTLKEDDEIKGILSHYDGGEFAFVDYFAIDGNQKGKGLGSKMLKRTAKKLNLFDALRMGIFQLFALLPGISRSGSTLTGGMLGGLSQKAARDFSFFMFMPVSFGAIILKLKDFLTSGTLGALWLPYLVAFIISGIVTYLALHLLFKLLDKKKLNVFSLYCLVVGILAVLFL